MIRFSELIVRKSYHTRAGGSGAWTFDRAISRLEPVFRFEAPGASTWTTGGRGSGGRPGAAGVARNLVRAPRSMNFCRITTPSSNLNPRSSPCDTMGRRWQAPAMRSNTESRDAKDDRQPAIRDAEAVIAFLDQIRNGLALQGVLLFGLEGLAPLWAGRGAAASPEVAALCRAVAGDRVRIVADLGAAPRWRDHPAVAGPPGCRFLATQPLGTDPASSPWSTTARAVCRIRAQAFRRLRRRPGLSRPCPAHGRGVAGGPRRAGAGPVP